MFKTNAEREKLKTVGHNETNPWRWTFKLVI